MFFMVEYRFRLIGVPPIQAIKSIDIDVNRTVEDAKERVRKVYKLDPSLTIQFIHKGRPLSDNMKFASLDTHPQKDVFTVMAVSERSSNDARWKVDASKLWVPEKR